jgi:TRAP-type C4-dicarboxylate transport system permease small subunit
MLGQTAGTANEYNEVLEAGMKYFAAVEKGVHRVSTALVYVSGACLFLMMSLTTIDVVGRYFFKHPLRGTQDLTELGLVVCAFGGWGYVTRQRQHIRADMINAVLSKRWNAIVGAACFMVSLPVAIIMAWQTSVEAIKVQTIGSAVTGTIGIPIGPFFLFAGFGFCWFCIEIVFDIVRSIREAEGKADRIKDEEAALL